MDGEQIYTVVPSSEPVANDVLGPTEDKLLKVN